MVAPQVPTRWAVGQAVCDHQPDRQIHHAVGVLSAGGRQLREVRVKVLATLRTGVLRIGDHEIPRTPQVEIPQVVQCPLVLLVAIGLVPTPRTRLPEVVATVGTSSGWGRSAGAVIPALGSGRYSPGPHIVLPSWRKGSALNFTTNVVWGQPGALATVSKSRLTLLY